MMNVTDELLEKIDRYIEGGGNGAGYNLPFQQALEKRIAEPWATQEQIAQFRDRLAKLRELQKGIPGPLGGSTWG